MCYSSSFDSSDGALLSSVCSVGSTVASRALPQTLGLRLNETNEPGTSAVGYHPAVFPHPPGCMHLHETYQPEASTGLYLSSCFIRLDETYQPGAVEFKVIILLTHHYHYCTFFSTSKPIQYFGDLVIKL